MATPQESRGAAGSAATPLFRIRLINIDHVLTQPGPLDRTDCAFNPSGQPLLRVPVLRVFGATPAGQRVCAHLHGVFPYCYVEYTGSLEPGTVLAYIQRLGRELNAAIAASLRRNPDDADKAQFVAAIHLCKGVPFYGYHVGWKYFLKVYFVDPSQNVRIATILQSGKIMGRKMQPYEMHIRYNLQFMLDYNLFGCDYVDLDRVAFRLPIPPADPFRSQDSRLGDEQRKHWDTASIDEALLQPEQVTRQSYCELEVDAQCADIMNRRRLRKRNVHQTFDETDNAGEMEKLVPSLTGLWEEEQARRVSAGLNPTIPAPESMGDKREYGKDEAPDWLATERLRGLLHARLDGERRDMKENDKYASTFTRVHPLDSHVVTAFDSVSLLHDVRQDKASGTSGQSAGLYNLEDSLSQPKAPAHKAAAASNSDHDSDESKVDVAFFSSQDFQREMHAAEQQRTKDDGHVDGSLDEGGPDDKGVDDRSGKSGNQVSNTFVSPSRVKHSITPKRRKVASSGEPSTSSSGASYSRPSRTRVRFASETTSGLESKGKCSLWTHKTAAPTPAEVARSFGYFGLPIVDHRDPWFSCAADVPKAREYAGRTFTFASLALSFLPDFETGLAVPKCENRRHSHVLRKWEFGKRPPSRIDVDAWLRGDEERARAVSNARRKRFLSQKPSLTQPTSLGFKLSQREPATMAVQEKQHMTILAIEVLTCTRGKLFPDPAKDAIQAIAYCFQHEDEALEDTGSRAGLRSGLIILDDADMDPARLGLGHLAVEMASTELDMFNALVDLVRAFDPEIILGYEIHSSSWGYVFERAMNEYEYDLISELGRVNSHNTGSRSDTYGATQFSSLRLSGRHTLNLWRLMRSELALNRYSYENVVFHLLRRRVAKFDWQTLTEWYQSGNKKDVSRVLLYVVDRVETCLELVEVSGLVFRTAEFARIYGVDFFSVISRGSQFKVESVMFRIAKPESFLLPSPSQQQVGTQNAAEDLPLVMEPQSAFYKGPVLVLDFQSLYPSLMVAYNICYSTCLGRVSKFRDSWKLGHTEHELPCGLLPLLEKNCFVSPNGLLFVKSKVRKSLLSKMLTEILDTRVMIKASMKGKKSDKAFLRLQNARQLSLKLLANVTYGYTSASFSGRMPCVEIADSIVRYGRETLERAIEHIHSVERWGAKVVYGDTDSLFIYLENRTREEAFALGSEIAEAVTARNPKPVKLKFEKVYLPCVLMAKKRYVGYMYETPLDQTPVFNAKGIETVRRDGFPAQQRMVEACIRLLFRTADLSLVKSYCQRQWLKMLHGSVLLQDFVFAKEVKLGSYSENGVLPPGAALAAKKMLLDKRNESQYGERVPYVIANGPAKARLVDLARDPLNMLQDGILGINAHYYITRGLIPPLSRIFNLLGADVESWFREMPKINTSLQSLPFLMQVRSSNRSGGRERLLDHYRAEVCLVCRRASEGEICVDCRSNSATTTYTLERTLQSRQRRMLAIHRICATCAHSPLPAEPTVCVNIDCPMLYESAKTSSELDAQAELLNQWHARGPDGSLEW